MVEEQLSCYPFVNVRVLAADVWQKPCVYAVARAQLAVRPAQLIEPPCDIEDACAAPLEVTLPPFDPFDVGGLHDS